MDPTRELLGRFAPSGFVRPALAASSARFPDGAAYRIEIPSTEGPECLRALLGEAADRDVPIHRVSQGSGALLLTDGELDEMADVGCEAGCEVSLFAQPGAAWEASAQARSPAGAVVAGASRGLDGLAAGLDDILRAAEHGIRSVLIADLGLLAVFGRLRDAGELPRTMKAKVSIMLAVTNPATAWELERLGADSLNVGTDLTVAQLAEIRAAVSIPLDVYIEAPDNVGGFVRHHEAAEIVRVAAPVYLKLGVANAPNLYPAGLHLAPTAIALSRERVRRAAMLLGHLRRAGVEEPHSVASSTGLAVPEPVAAG